MTPAVFVHLRQRIQGLFSLKRTWPCLLALAISTPCCPVLQAEDQLPDIEVRRLELLVEKKSTNGRVVLFSARPRPETDAGAPAVRQLILIKQDGLPRKALRVLKLFEPTGLDEGSSRFAAQIVRDYAAGPALELELKGEYSGTLKIRDLTLEELDQSVARGDENEGGTSTQLEPFKEGDSLPVEEKSARDLTEEEERELQTLAYDEPPNFEPERDGIGLQAGLIKTGNFTEGEFIYLQAAGIRYSRTFTLPVWYNSRTRQDSLAFDASALFAKRLEYAEAGDSYTIMPVQFMLRYNMNFGESFAIFGYAGVMKGFVLAAVSSGANDAQARAQLGLLQPALGVGALLRVGPQWYLRGELGIEQASAGLTLKF